MIAIDLCCKAGGASMGYHRAGFTMIGIDNEPQPRYPFEFHRADVTTLTPEALLAYNPSAIFASPPCKLFTTLNPFAGTHHLNLIPAVRELCIATGLPYVIENVPGAPLYDPVILCGSAFGLGVRRHRRFESNLPLDEPGCRHAEQNAASPMYPVRRYHDGYPRIVMSPVVGVYGSGQGLGPGEVDLWRRAMGIDWMTRDELAQAIPPAYTEYIGRQVMATL